MPTDEELKGGIVAYGISNVVGAVLASADGNLQSECRYCSIYEGCSKKGIPYCGNDSACCRSGACILSSFDNDSFIVYWAVQQFLCLPPSQ